MALTRTVGAVLTVVVSLSSSPALADDQLPATLPELLTQQQASILKLAEEELGKPVDLTKPPADVAAAWAASLPDALTTKLDAADKDARVMAASVVETASSSGYVSRTLASRRAKLTKALDTVIADKRKLLAVATAGDLASVKNSADAAVRDLLAVHLAQRTKETVAASKNKTVSEVVEATQDALTEERAKGINEFLAQYDKGAPVSPIMRCIFSPGVGDVASKIGCDASALRVGGSGVSHVSIVGLEKVCRARVTARITESYRHHWRKKLEKAKPVEDYPPLRWFSEQTITFCPQYADCEPQDGCIDLPVGLPVEVDVHTTRAINPTYKREFMDKFESLVTLRQDYPNKLSLVTGGNGRELLLTIETEVDERTEIVTERLPVGYERWMFETGTLFAVSPVVDEELVTETATKDGATVTKVVDKRHADTYGQETALYLNMVPRNYESFALGVGFHSSSDRPLSYYVGGSVRVRGLGERALASFSAGLAGISVTSFPGVHECTVSDVSKCPAGSLFSPNDSALKGRPEHHHSWFVGLSLGFRFGPVGGEAAQ